MSAHHAAPPTAEGSLRHVVVLAAEGPGTPYLDWLAPHGAAVSLLAGGSPTTGTTVDGARRVETFPGWFDDRTVDHAVCEIHRTDPVDRIIALHPGDQVRAAELRQRLSLPGRIPASAVAYRDRLAVLVAAADDGLDVPMFAAVDTAGDLLRFIDDNGWPVVVRPREDTAPTHDDADDGSGTALRGRTADDGSGTVLRGPDDLARWLSRTPVRSDEHARHVVTEYLDAPVLAVDGLMSAGRIVIVTVNRYPGVAASPVGGDDHSSTVHTLSAESKPARLATEYLDRLFTVSPPGDDAFAFHAELLDDPHRGPVLRDISLGVFSARCRAALTGALGVDPAHWSCLGEAGLDPTWLLTSGSDR